MFSYVPFKHKQMSFVSNGGKFKLYTVLNGLLFPTPTQPRISFERAIQQNAATGTHYCVKRSYDTLLNSILKTWPLHRRHLDAQTFPGLETLPCFFSLLYCQGQVSIAQKMAMETETDVNAGIRSYSGSRMRTGRIIYTSHFQT
jgi:hypothetical protein